MRHTLSIGLLSLGSEGKHCVLRVIMTGKGQRAKAKKDKHLFTVTFRKHTDSNESERSLMSQYNNISTYSHEKDCHDF